MSVVRKVPAGQFTQAVLPAGLVSPALQGSQGMLDPKLKTKNWFLGHCLQAACPLFGW